MKKVVNPARISRVCHTRGQCELESEGYIYLCFFSKVTVQNRKTFSTLQKKIIIIIQMYINRLYLVLAMVTCSFVNLMNL